MVNELIKGYHKKLSNEDIVLIKNKIDYLLRKLSFSEDVIEELVNTMCLFCEKKKLDIINDESIDLLVKILGNENNEIYAEDEDYFFLRMKQILLSFKEMKCENKENLDVFLMEYDLLFNLMVMNLEEKDFLKLAGINKELKEVVEKYQEIINVYQSNDIFKYDSIVDKVIINTTLAHLAVMLYLFYDEFDYQSDLLEKVFNRILSNYAEYLYECYYKGIYQDIIEEGKTTVSVQGEYLICYEMLKKEYNPPIKSSSYHYLKKEL